MKKRVVDAILFGLLLAGLVVIFSGRRESDPKDLSYWVRAGGNKDWSADAAQAKPEAQFFLGLSLIRTNLTKMIDRIPVLSNVPVLGRRFERITYGVDNSIGEGQLAEAYRWIKKSADQGYAPAREAEKLFIGRVPTPNQSSKANPTLR